MSNKPSIVFMGTPDFAVPCLTELYAAGYPIPLVISQPDRPKGRGKKLAMPPVKEKALALDLPVVQPENLRNEEICRTLTELAPDYFVVVAFGHILRQNVLDIPQKGAINIHGSILPKYRGSAPIQWAVINGDRETGVTTMFMDKGTDTGDILEIVRVPITESDTAASMYARLAPLGADLLLSTLTKLEQGKLTPQKQNNAAATLAPMLTKEDGRINWRDPATKIACRVRGLYPWPGAFTFMGQTRIKICNAVALPDKGLAPGEIKLGPNDQLWSGTSDGTLNILEVQCANSKQMKCSLFLRGYKYRDGASFTSSEQPG